MPYGDDLRAQQRDFDLRAEQYLDAHASSLVSTANVCITLGTALAGGLVLMARVGSQNSLSPVYGLFLGLAALATIGSMIAGLFVYVGHAGINRRAMVLCETRRRVIREVLASSDEHELRSKRIDSIPEAADAIATARSDYENRVNGLGTVVALQAGLLVGAVFFAMLATFLAYIAHAL